MITVVETHNRHKDGQQCLISYNNPYRTSLTIHHITIPYKCKYICIYKLYIDAETNWVYELQLYFLTAVKLYLTQQKKNYSDQTKT